MPCREKREVIQDKVISFKKNKLKFCQNLKYIKKWPLMKFQNKNYLFLKIDSVDFNFDLINLFFFKFKIIKKNKNSYGLAIIKSKK